MKRSSKPIAQQFNLSLLIAAPIVISQDKQRELKPGTHGVADRRRLPKSKKKRRQRKRR